MITFSVLLALGAILGLIGAVLQAPLGDRYVYLNAGIWALVGTLIGSRIAYVAFHWSYFQDQLIEIPQFWLGGLSWPGALAGGLIAVILFAWLMGLSLDCLIDAILPLPASLSVATWLGCLIVGCAYGPEVDAWWGIPTQDEWGIWKARLPLQLICALLSIVLFWGIERLRQHGWGLIPGVAASLGLGGVALILLGASLLRVDPYPLWNGMRLETWAALLFLGVALASGYFAILMNRR